MNLDARHIAGGLIVGLLVASISFIGGWVLTVSDRVARVEERQVGNVQTVDVSLAALSQRIGSLEALVGELNRRLRDGRAEGKVESKSKGG